MNPTKCRHCGKLLSNRAIKLAIDICRRCANSFLYGSRKRTRDIYVLDGTRVRTNGSLIAVAQDPEIENVFQLNPGKVRIRHYSFRKEKKNDKTG